MDAGNRNHDVLHRLLQCAGYSGGKRQLCAFRLHRGCTAGQRARAGDCHADAFHYGSARNADPHAYAHAYSYTDSHAYADGDAYAHAYPHSYAYPHAYAHAYSYADSHAYPHACAHDLPAARLWRSGG